MWQACRRRAGGAAPADARAQAVVDEMYQATTSMWTPDRAAFAQVGEQMATQADSRALLERVSPDAAPLLEPVEAPLDVAALVVDRVEHDRPAAYAHHDVVMLRCTYAHDH